MAFQDQTGIPVEALGTAMARMEERDGAHPLYELEKGRITEPEFLNGLRGELTVELGHVPELRDFKEIYFEALNPNQEMISEMREVREAGYRTAMLTNNVREWEPLWRSMLPVDEIFELVVDSAFVGMRKPEPEIYELTLERIRAHDPAELGDLEFAECLFVDDFEVNCNAARALGINAVRFESNEQALAEIRAALAAAAT